MSGDHIPTFLSNGRQAVTIATAFLLPISTSGTAISIAALTLLTILSARKNRLADRFAVSGRDSSDSAFRIDRGEYALVAPATGPGWTDPLHKVTANSADDGE